MTPTLEETEAFVREKFAGQEDRSGVPMADHMMRVVANLEGEDEFTLHAGWLHDIVEDTDVTLNELTDKGYAYEVVEAVAILTRDEKNETYAEYIDRIVNSGNERALRVKLADQMDNKDPRRQIKLNRYVRNALMKRYAGVEEKLMGALLCLNTIS